MEKEIWDAYDECFRLVEPRRLVRGEKIPDGLFHLVCDIRVRHRDGSFLLMKRAAVKRDGGKWEISAGGSALAGECAEECARRELLEETGIEKCELSELGRLVIHSLHSVYVEYLAITDCEKSSIKLQAGETEDFLWASPEEIKALPKDSVISDRVRIFIPELKNI